MQPINKLVALAISAIIILPTYAQEPPAAPGANTQASESPEVVHTRQQNYVKGLIDTILKKEPEKLRKQGLSEAEIQPQIEQRKKQITARFYELRQEIEANNPNQGTAEQKDQAAYLGVLMEAKEKKV